MWYMWYIVWMYHNLWYIIQSKLYILLFSSLFWAPDPLFVPHLYHNMWYMWYIVWMYHNLWYVIYFDRPTPSLTPSSQPLPLYPITSYYSSPYHSIPSYTTLLFFPSSNPFVYVLRYWKYSTVSKGSYTPGATRSCASSLFSFFLYLLLNLFPSLEMFIASLCQTVHCSSPRYGQLLLRSREKVSHWLNAIEP